MLSIKIRIIFFSVLFIISLNGQAFQKKPLRICKGDKDFSPYTNLTGTGEWQMIMQKISKELSLDITFHEVPRKRCILEVKKNNESDALFIEASDDVKNTISFPMDRKRSLDKKARIATLNYVVLVNKNSPLAWNGKLFTHLDGKAIGVRRGRVKVQEVLQNINVPFEETETSEQSIEKLKLKRIEALIIEKDQINELKNKIDLSSLIQLSQSFAIYDIYLGVSTSYYLKNKEMVEELWNNFRKLH